MALVLPQLITQSFISTLEKAITQKKHQVKALSDFLLTENSGVTTPKEETSTEETENHSSRLTVEIKLALLILAILYIQNCIM